MLSFILLHALNICGVIHYFLVGSFLDILLYARRVYPILSFFSCLEIEVR